MNKNFEEDLDKLRTRLIRMGSLVEEQVEFAFRAVRDGNNELAKIVTERDDKVDDLDLKIDKQCQRIFALSQPVASDLRLLLAAIKINNELERIGDIAAGVASMVLRSTDVTTIARRIGGERIMNAAYMMVKSSLDAFINNDPGVARHIIPADDAVDSLRASMHSEVIEIMQNDPALIRGGAEFILALHNIERIAGHATNIAENVIFLAEAKLVKHSGPDSEEAPNNP
jgi:phosphate transport system protein